MTSRAKHWCFTLNNPAVELDKAFLLSLPCTYVVFQLERGENDTPHFQGVIGFPKQKRFSAIKKIDPRIHWEVARSPPASIAYCQKEDTRVDGPWQAGDVPTRTQGRRTDLSRCLDMVDEGKSKIEIYHAHREAYSRNYKAIHHVQLMITPDRTTAPRCYLFYGPTGTGKTTAAFKLFKNPVKIVSTKHNIWFDRYDPIFHDTVVFDDFYGNMAWTELLNLCDWSPHSVQFKGGYLPFLAKTIIFTSNKHYTEWYKFTQDFSPLTRRFADFGGVIKFELDGVRQLEIGDYPVEFNAPPPPDLPVDNQD